MSFWEGSDTAVELDVMIDGTVEGGGENGAELAYDL